MIFNVSDWQRTEAECLNERTLRPKRILLSSLLTTKV